MLLHGTNRKNAVGIHEKGFKPSSQGKHGPGVYLTDRSYCAGLFAGVECFFKRSSSGFKDRLLFIFLNEIFESEKIEKIIIDKEANCKTDSPRKHQFEKYVIKGTVKKHAVKTYEKDNNGRKIRCYAPTKAELNNYFVCHEKFVVPRYLIQCFPKFDYKLIFC